MGNTSGRRHFDLSRNTSLRTLETTAESITAAGDSSSGFLKSILSTVTSPVHTDVVIVYREEEFNFDVQFSTRPISVRYKPWLQSDHPGRFEVFREMCGARKFRLVLCADVLDCIADSAVRKLERLLDVERKEGRLGCFACEPVVISKGRAPRVRFRDVHTGDARELGKFFCVL